VLLLLLLLDKHCTEISSSEEVGVLLVSNAQCGAGRVNIPLLALSYLVAAQCRG
jgi:hypothetical protein